MDYKVILSPLAVSDLQEIVRYVAADDPAAAERLGLRLIGVAETLRKLPRRGHPVRRRPGVRKVVLTPYLVFYEVNDATQSVDVLRFWHGARDSKDLRFD
jgi:plasmid stabilization system protein ParE